MNKMQQYMNHDEQNITVYSALCLKPHIVKLYILSLLGIDSTFMQWMPTYKKRS